MVEACRKGQAEKQVPLPATRVQFPAAAFSKQSWNISFEED